MDARLLPCPFCGMKSSLRVKNTHTAAFWVECDDGEGGCGAQVHGEPQEGPHRDTRFVYDPEGIDWPFCARSYDELHPEYKAALRSAVQRWNHRA